MSWIFSILSHLLLSHPWPSPAPVRVCWAPRTLGCLGGPESQALRVSSWRVQKKEEATLSLTSKYWPGLGRWQVWLKTKEGNRTIGLACGLESHESFCSVEKYRALNRQITRFHRARPLLLKESRPRKLRGEGN